MVFSLKFLVVGSFLVPSSTSFNTFITFPNSSISSTSLKSFPSGFESDIYLSSSSFSYSYILFIASFLIFTTFLVLTLPNSSLNSSSSYTTSSSSTTFPSSSTKTLTLSPYLYIMVFSLKFLVFGVFLIPSSTSFNTFLIFPNSSISSYTTTSSSTTFP